MNSVENKYCRYRIKWENNRKKESSELISDFVKESQKISTKWLVEDVELDMEEIVNKLLV